MGADGSAVASGLRELNAGIDRLEPAVTARLKATARASADTIARTAAGILLSKTHGTGRTARSIRVIDESAEKQYVVNCPGHPDAPKNLPTWLEFGTRFMSARAFMRPAADAESERYKQNMAQAAQATAEEVLK